MSRDTPAALSTTRCLPRRRTPVSGWPAIVSSGGANVLSVLMPGATADSTPTPATASEIRRAVISTSGSSGIGAHRADQHVGEGRHAASLVELPGSVVVLQDAD